LRSIAANRALCAGPFQFIETRPAFNMKAPTKTAFADGLAALQSFPPGRGVLRLQWVVPDDKSPVPTIANLPM
jgi:hypothetical protein